MVYISLLLIINVVSIVIHCVVGESIGLRKHAGKRLHVTYKSVLADSAIHCNALCRRETSCRTSNHNKGTGECHFSEICHSDIEGNMVTDSNWDVYALNNIDQCGCNYNAISGHSLGTGSIVSPLYPADYPPSKLCDWLITAPSGYHVTLSFSRMDLEGNINCEYDSLEAYDGYYNGYPLVGRFCGVSIPNPIRSCTGNYLFLRFQTDGSVQQSGFKVTWNFVPAVACGCDYHNIAGTLTSPNYPSPYNVNQVCTWTVTTEGGAGTVAITIDDFELETHDTCDYDILEIRNGYNEYGTLIGGFCTMATPWSYTIGNAMYVRFKTDGSVELRGFRLHWTITYL